MRVVVVTLMVIFTSGGEAGRSPRPAGEKGEQASVTLAFAGYASGSSVALGAPALRGQMRIDEALLSLGDVRFRDQRSCDRSGGTSVVAGAILADLVTGRASGADARFALPAAAYCRMEYTPQRARGGGSAPSGMRGYAVMVRGRRDDGVRFSIRSRRRDLVRLVARDTSGFTLATGTSRLFLAVDLGRWMEGIDLGALPPGRGRDGIIRIDDGSNRELLQAFEKNVLAGLALCRDQDDDGALSPRERSDGACLAHAR